jgi:hypothetical protein
MLQQLGFRSEGRVCVESPALPKPAAWFSFPICAPSGVQAGIERCAPHEALNVVQRFGFQTGWGQVLHPNGFPMSLDDPLACSSSEE